MPVRPVHRPQHYLFSSLLLGGSLTILGCDPAGDQGEGEDESGVGEGDSGQSDGADEGGSQADEGGDSGVGGDEATADEQGDSGDGDSETDSGEEDGAADSGGHDSAGDDSAGSGATSGGETSSDDDGSTDDAGDSDDTGDNDPCPDEVFLDIASGPGAGPGYPHPRMTVSCTAEQMTVESNGIPHYKFVPLTPNALTEQNHRWTVPLRPQMADAETDIPLLGLVGFSVAGQPFFGPNEADRPADSAWGDPIFNGIVDECMGHTAREYHHHAFVQKCLIPESLVEEPWKNPDVSPDEPSPILGFAMDGFPIYGRYGCEDSDCNVVVEHRSSWEQVGDPKRDAWDAYEYVAKDGPEFLDRCNGHIGPDGDYHYHATETFPYIIGCYKGRPRAQVAGD